MSSKVFLPIGDKETKGQSSNVLFQNFGNGVKTNRDDWTWNFDRERLAASIKTTIDVYI